MSTENVTVAELLALRAIVSVLLAEKIRDFNDEAAAAFELAASCSEIVNEADLSASDVGRNRAVHIYRRTMECDEARIVRWSC